MGDRWGYQAFSEPGDWHVQAETDIGQKFEAASCYTYLDDSDHFTRQDGVVHMTEVGGLVYLNINALVDAPNKVPVDYADIRAGQYDDDLLNWGAVLKTFVEAGGKLIVTWQHEPTAHSPQQPKTGDWSGPAYIETFRYVAEAVDQASGHSLRWGYYPVVAAFASNNARAYYPGSDVIEVIGADVYYHGGKATLVDKVAKFVSFAQVEAKPIAIGELGDTVSTGRPERLQALTTYLLALPLKLIHINWNAKQEYGLMDHSGPTYDAWVAESKKFYP